MAAILFYTYPIFVTLSAMFFTNEKITFLELLATILTFAGAALVIKAYDISSLSLNLLGILSGLASSFLFVLYFMIAKRLGNKYASWTLTLYGDGIGALTLTPILTFSFP